MQCNLTLVFALKQAKACADAGAFLISSFVGRITDWYKKANGVDEYAPETDPGVKSVREIYAYYKSHGIETIVMGASFWNTGQIKALAGCDRLTISPALLGELAQGTGTLACTLAPHDSPHLDVTPMSEAAFRWGMNKNAMATEKMAEGIRQFNAESRKLLKIVADKL